MAFNRLSLVVASAIAVAAAVSLSGCGRKGGLDLPPSDTATPPPPSASSQSGPFQPPTSFFSSESQSGATAQANATKNGFDNQGNPVAPPAQQKSFPLDFLLK